MRKRKPKLLNHRMRETKESQITLHIKVYRNEGKNFTSVHLF